MKLFYRSFGEGPPLFILHGMYGSSDNWVTIAKKLASNFRVILPDQRNHGQSPHSNIHTYDALRDDLYELALDLNYHKFFLAGHSMGGKTAVAFALKWPQMLNGLLIADISPFVNENSGNIIKAEHISILKTILAIDPADIKSRLDLDKKLSETIHSEKVRGFILKNLQRNEMDKFSWKINAESLYNNLDNIMEGIDTSSWVNNQVSGFPVMFLRGEKSLYIPDNHLKDIIKVFPAAEFITIPGAGHWLHADAPEAVIECFLRFL
jgi:esterase